MRNKRHTVLMMMLLCLLMGWGVQAQFDDVNTGQDDVKGNALFDFMIGEWAVQSERWLQAYDSKMPEGDQVRSSYR